MVKEFGEKTEQKKNKDKIPLYQSLIIEEYKEWVMTDDPEEELKELADLLYVIYGYCYQQDWDIDEAVKRVHANNLGRCIQPDGSIKRREDGKIIKNKQYPKVDLSDLVYGDYLPYE